MIFGLQYALVVAGYAATAFLLGHYMILYAGASQLELGLMFTIQPAVILVRPVVCSLADRYQAHRSIYLYCSLLSFLFHLPFIFLPFVVVASTPNATYQELASKVEQDQDVAPEGLPLVESVFNSTSAVRLAAEATSTRAPGMQRGQQQLQQQQIGCLMMELAGIFTERVRFWVLVVSHFLGCIFFCCMRTLGDVLTVNYCRRMRTNYTKYRKLSPISFGMCSLVLGYINCNQQLMGLPDYVPGFILYSTCHMSLFVLFYLWPEEYFEMVSEAQVSSGQLRPLASAADIRRHMKRKLLNLITLGLVKPVRSLAHEQEQQQEQEQEQEQEHQGQDARRKQQEQIASLPTRISTMQQVRIVRVLFEQDFRIPLFMLVLVGCGVMGHSVQNFVYVYLAQECREQNCSSSNIAGYIMLGICVTETFAYSLSSHCFKFNSRQGASLQNKLTKVELALLVLALHYLVLACLVRHSAYFFLAEALHGFEFGLMIATGIELGDYFANEVALIIPQLLERGIIQKSDNPDLVRVSLNATMLGCFLLVYDGLGGIIGCLLFGFVVDSFGFLAAFWLNALLSSIFLATLLVCTFATKRLGIKPKISLLERNGQHAIETRSNRANILEKSIAHSVKLQRNE